MRKFKIYDSENGELLAELKANEFYIEGNYYTFVTYIENEKCINQFGISKFNVIEVSDREEKNKTNIKDIKTNIQFELDYEKILKDIKENIEKYLIIKTD